MATVEIAPQADNTATGELQRIPLQQIIPSPTNPRKHIDQGELEQLAQNIQAVGLLEPIVVRAIGFGNDEKPELYEIVAGERRYRAHQFLQKQDSQQFGAIDCVVRDLTDEQVLDLQVSENLQRADLQPLDWAAAYRAMVDMARKHQAGVESSAVQIVAAKLGVSVSTVYQTLQLAKLTPEAAEALRSGKITKYHAIDCARLNREQQEAFLQYMRDWDWEPGVRQMRRWIREQFHREMELPFTAEEAEKGETNEDQHNVDSGRDVPSHSGDNSTFAPAQAEKDKGNEDESDRDQDSARLKRFEDAIAGRKLSGIAAYQVNEAIRGFGKVAGYSEGEKLNASSKRALQDVCNELRARGVMPAETLLSEYQQSALKNKTSDAKAERTTDDDRTRGIITEVVREHSGSFGAYDVIARALADTVSFTGAQFICELLRWPKLELGSNWNEQFVRLYEKNWARDRMQFVLACAITSLSYSASDEQLVEILQDLRKRRPYQANPKQAKAELKQHGQLKCTNHAKCKGFYRAGNKHPYCRDCQRKGNFSRAAAKKAAKKGGRK